MIKFAVRRNLIYPLQLLLWNFLRDTESSLINHFFEVKGFLIYTFLMFLGELLAGLIFYSLLRHYVKGHNKGDSEQFMNIKYIHNERYFSRRMDIKAYFLIFASSFSDFIQFTIFYELRKYGTISKSLEQRLRINFTLYNALFYYYVIKLPLFKHHIFSLITICICFFIIVITESFFQEFDIFLSYRQFAEALSIMLFIQFGNALIESIEKYLYEYYQLVPFYVLMFQGFFGSIITIIYYIIYSPFDEIIQFYKKRTTSEFIILIFAFLLFVILSGGKNLFRVVTTKIFSPMTTTFMDYILNPLYIIFYFVTEYDFITNGKRNYLYFILNLIIAFITSICGAVYNEFLILFCCGLERETHNQIVKRAEIENELSLLQDEEDKSSA